MSLINRHGFVTMISFLPWIGEVFAPMSCLSVPTAQFPFSLDVRLDHHLFRKLI